jgi:hypothetical protein
VRTAPRFFISGCHQDRAARDVDVSDDAEPAHPACRPVLRRGDAEALDTSVTVAATIS